MHGYLSSKESFYYQTEYLSRYFKVFAPDLTGFKERDLPFPYSLFDYAKEIDEYLTAVIEDAGRIPSVVAHSFGARIVFYLSPSEKIDKLVLTGAAGVKRRKKLSVKLKIAAYKFVKRVFNCKIERFGSSDYKSLSPTMKQSFNKIIAEDLSGKIPLVKNKTLIIHGENDKDTPPDTAIELNKKIAGSELVFIKNAGHFCFVDDPMRFNTLVKEFLS